MCGILGGNFKDWDYKKGIESLYHRGPDGNRVKKAEEFTLAFTRLAIMDLTDNGMQPMSSSDGKVCLVFNGEIYGFQSLKSELIHKYKFSSSSDTEVILYAYMEYGDEFIDKIDGMFAISILDLRERKLKLYRDRSGIKPLYYCLYDGKIAFASEMKALVEASKNSRMLWKLDTTALYDYLFYQYIPAPKTMYQGCYKLQPASCLIYNIDSHKIENIFPYWQLHVNVNKKREHNEKDVSETLRELLHNSVCEQLVADVPVGTFLSGGIDSSIITYEANLLSPMIETFTIGFHDTAYDESCYANALAESCGLNNKVDFFNTENMDKLEPLLTQWYDEPFADTSAFPTYALSRLARKSVKVVLTGDGGDELFGGYQRYQIFADRMSDKVFDSVSLSHFAELNRLDLFCGENFSHRYLTSGIDEYCPVIFVANNQQVSSYKKIWKIPDDYDVTWHLKKHYCKDLPVITRARYLDFMTYLPGDILTKVDRASMALSLEARVPFLSRKVIEYAFSLSSEECCSGLDLKRCLKQAYRGILPEKLLHRKKRGFSIPNFYCDSRSKYKSVSVMILEKYWKQLSRYSC
ncbi:asparagine synthase (glutamine-hydrolyzing) [Pectinatus frisingensis]|uniref:asparagine synthase (glutamine-hydrolyzing) n=1 Tax=Pectinatus frisingensis TaxID=865 RepID=UPI0018C7D402|nr:asparagine synthase (glutamine-hydrolyzing) [Pectinatus frisingensis]